LSSPSAGHWAFPQALGLFGRFDDLSFSLLRAAGRPNLGPALATRLSSFMFRVFHPRFHCFFNRFFKFSHNRFFSGWLSPLSINIFALLILQVSASSFKNLYALLFFVLMSFCSWYFC
jgi:hypothetical protein